MVKQALDTARRAAPGTITNRGRNNGTNNSTNNSSSSNGTGPKTPLMGGVTSSQTLGELDESTQLDSEQFEELLNKIDNGLRALPATAQVSKGGRVWAKERWECLAWLTAAGDSRDLGAWSTGHAMVKPPRYVAARCWVAFC